MQAIVLRATFDPVRYQFSGAVPVAVSYPVDQSAVPIVTVMAMRIMMQLPANLSKWVA